MRGGSGVVHVERPSYLRYFRSTFTVLIAVPTQAASGEKGTARPLQDVPTETPRMCHILPLWWSLLRLRGLCVHVCAPVCTRVCTCHVCASVRASAHVRACVCSRGGRPLVCRLEGVLLELYPGRRQSHGFPGARREGEDASPASASPRQCGLGPPESSEGRQRQWPHPAQHGLCCGHVRWASDSDGLFGLMLPAALESVC